MQRYTIPGADDEIDLLKTSHLISSQRGMTSPRYNGSEAVELCEAKHFDVSFWMNTCRVWAGLRPQPHQKTISPTSGSNDHQKWRRKNHGGSDWCKIEDYLIKPINPSQILLSVKKILDNKRLVIEKTTLIISRSLERSAWLCSTTWTTSNGPTSIRSWCIGTAIRRSG